MILTLTLVFHRIDLTTQKQQGVLSKVCLTIWSTLHVGIKKLDVTDMDVIFAIAHKEGVSPVGVSLRKDIPQAGTVEANKILGILEDTSNGQNDH